jgi:NADPH-dependent 2,4-dienoyl-CoA reductase/sulfur reductase-like enzyme
MPYTRPPLSKELLASPAQAAVPYLRPADLEATWLLEQRATELDRAARRVGLAGGEQIPYERVVIATGSRPRPWAGPGAELAGLHLLRTVDDAVALRDAFAAGPRVAIVGAGFIGCEVASSARALGLDVALFDIVRAPMPALGDLLGERCAALHRAHGVDLRLGTGVAALHGSGGRICAVELADGSRHEADVVVLALGAVPCTEWLAGTGLALDHGVRCDVTLTVLGDPDLLAAGDVAAWPHALADGGPIRVEHWTNAAEQGALAGRNAVVPAAAREPYGGVPSFWSDQYGVKIQAVGVPHLADRQLVVEESEDGARLVAIAERAGVLIGAVGFDAARRMPHYRRQLGGPVDLDRIHAAIAHDPNALGAPERLSA